MTKVAGIEFAPLNIPFKRRLQTFAAFFWSSSFLFFGFSGLVITIWLLFTKYYYVTLLYALWFIYDRERCHRGGRRSNWVRNWTIWKLFRDYFPIKLVKTAELDPNKNYIFGYHPHGIMCAGAFCNFGTEATAFSKNYPGIIPSVCTLTGNFWWPFHRGYIMSCGACSVSKPSLEHILSKQGKGNAAIIVIGGAAEALDAKPKKDIVLTLKNRKGFVKMALRFGASLVPVFSFGENDLYEQVPNPEGSKLRNFQTKFKSIIGFSPPVILGRGLFQYSFGYVPYRHPIFTVVGKPIDLEKIENPTTEDIDKYHKLYVESLQQLFEEHKKNSGDDYKDRVLKIN